MAERINIGRRIAVLGGKARAAKRAALSSVEQTSVPQSIRALVIPEEIVEAAGVKWHLIISLNDGVPFADRLIEQPLHDFAGMRDVAVAAGTHHRPLEQPAQPAPGSSENWCLALVPEPIAWTRLKRLR